MTNQSAPIIDTAEGKLQGIVEHEAFAFLGIPYARPPVGDLRWRAPAPVAAWSAIHRTDTRRGDRSAPVEDCLYLDVWIPQLAPASPWPVMVWLGDTRTIGDAVQSRYTGAALASRGVIVVAVRCRPGVFGCFAHPGLDAEAPGGPANFALLDHIAALEWVQRNIAGFGGDPGNVTILGQSAGARSVLALYASPLTRDRGSRPLFHRGVAHSAYGLDEVGRMCASTRSARALGAGLTAAQLRAIPAAELARRLPAAPPVAIGGDPVLPISIHDAFAAGQELALPLILGSTSDDASIVERFGLTAMQVLERIGAAGFDLGPMYAEVEDDAELARQVARDVLFTVVPRRLGDVHCRRAPTWRYYFDHVPAALHDRYPGARHGDDVPYAMASAGWSPAHGALGPADRDLQHRISAYWLAFARTGWPGSAGGVDWRPHAGVLQDVTLLLADPIEAQLGFMGWRLAAYLAGGLGNLPLPVADAG